MAESSRLRHPWLASRCRQEAADPSLRFPDFQGISSKNKKGSKTFSLRNVDSTSSGTFKALIRAQLHGDIDDEFDIGYQHKDTIVTIRNSVFQVDVDSALSFSFVDCGLGEVECRAI